MVKKQIKIYLEQKSEKLLKEKAEALGFVGRGAISHYVEKVATEEIIFMDDNLKTFSKFFDMVPK